MSDKDSVKKRYLSEIPGAVEDWNKHILEHANENEKLEHQKIIDEQEEHGNVTNFNLGREMWYSNEYYIECQIKDLIEYVKDDDVLYEELRNIYVGLTTKRDPNAMAMNDDEEFEGHLITINIGMEMGLLFISDFISQYLYYSLIDDKSEKDKLVPDLTSLLVCLINDNYMAEHIANFLKESHDDIDLESPPPKMEIASQIFEGSMKFVLGHEIGHHILRHTASDRKYIVSKYRPVSLNVSPDQLDEFAADSFGFDLLIRGMKKINSYILFASPLIVILLLAIRDDCPEKSSKHHPSQRDRYLNLLSKISEVDEGIAEKLQDTLDEVASWIRNRYNNQIVHWTTEWWKD